MLERSQLYETRGCYLSFFRFAGDAFDPDTVIQESAKSVVKLLGGLPLALAQAGPAIRQTLWTTEEFIEK